LLARRILPFSQDLIVPAQPDGMILLPQTIAQQLVYPVLMAMAPQDSQLELQTFIIQHLMHAVIQAIAALRLR
jgi:hypothetical protein